MHRPQKQHFLSKSFIYNDLFWINKFNNKFMKNGNKKVVIKHIHKSFYNIKPRNAVYILFKSMVITRSFISVKKLFRHRRKGRRRRIILIPVPIKWYAQLTLSLGWVVDLILIQKKSRRRHKYKNQIIFYDKKSKGLSTSKKKTYYDRFHVTLPTQKLTDLITNKLIEFELTKYNQLIRRKLNLYVTIANNRTNSRLRWV